MFQFGVTERGDAGIDLSWEKHMDSVAGAILITKNLTEPFLEAVMRHKTKVIVHAGITGFGATVYEPHVPPVWQMFEQLKKLHDMGFPKELVVIRVDPIIPVYTNSVWDFSAPMSVIQKALDLGYRRFRISMLDMYPHVQTRLKFRGIPTPFTGFTAPSGAFQDLDRQLLWFKLRYPDAVFEACAEPRLTEVQHIGCVSQKDFGLLGIPAPNDEPQHRQRHDCLCHPAKTELFRNAKHPCPHKCVYCYWKDQ